MNRIGVSLFVFGLLLVPSVAFAQDLFVGGRGQIGWTTLNSDDASADEGIDGRLGFGLAGQLIFNFDESYGIQAEAGWARRGASSSIRLFEIEGSVTSAETDVVLEYLEIPILLRLHYYGAETDVVPKLLVGPYLAGFVTGTSTGEAFGLRFETDLEAGDDIDPIDVGLVVGVGADFPVGQNMIFTGDLRLQHGFIGVEVEDGDSAVFNFALTANVGIAFGIL